MERKNWVENQPVSLEDWQSMFSDIFKEKNARDYDLTELFSHIPEQTAKVDEGFRKEKREEIIKALPYVFSWFLSFCNRAEVNVAEAAFEKYPEICPYCEAKESCICITISKNDRASEWFKNPQGEVPSSLNDWQKMFGKIYGAINRAIGQLKVLLHLHEEQGELSKALRLREEKTEDNFREEIADVFAWLIALCNNLEVNLAEITWDIYPGICDKCKKGKCQCPKV